jgi:hypothetical protein
VLCSEIHESRKRRVAQLGSAAQRDLILAIQFESQQAGGFLGEVAFLQIGGPQQRRGTMSGGLELLDPETGEVLILIRCRFLDHFA